jgi:hypothetical protein
VHRDFLITLYIDSLICDWKLIERFVETNQELCVDGQRLNIRIILIWIFKKLNGVVGTGWSWLRIGTGGGHL